MVRQKSAKLPRLVRFQLLTPFYRGIEKQYLEGLISPSSWCDSRSRNQIRSYSISVSIPHCHCGETGSIPVGTAKFLLSSSRGLGHRPFTAGTRVRISLRAPSCQVRWDLYQGTISTIRYRFDRRVSINSIRLSSAEV